MVTFMLENFITNKMPPKETTFTRSTIEFILNLRDVKIPPKTTKDQLLAELGEITEDEYELMEGYQNVRQNKTLMEYLRRKGWFKKNFLTVKEKVMQHVKPGTIVHLPTHNAEGAEVQIAKLFYYLMARDIDIPMDEISLDEEQMSVVQAVEGVTVVNSGPGTGKTTTAVKKASVLMREGVFVLMYTNAAVKSFQSKLINFIDNMNEVSTEPGSSVCLMTIDRLSHAIYPKKFKNINFDKQIDASIRDIDMFSSVFLSMSGEPRYRHMIIDEAQDVNDNRFRLIKENYLKWGFRSLTIIGDPRQRLDINAGGTFQRLLACGDKETPDYIGTFEKPKVVELHYTYRFRNPVLLKLANVLSSFRTKIHVELISKAEQIEEEKIQKFHQKLDIVSKIVELVKERGVSPSQICIISPAVKKAGATTTSLRTIVQALDSQSVTTSHEYGKEAIYVTSIQSSKGLEFDYVFFLGASGYPSYMNMEYLDINDGLSMSFVAMTRARKVMFFLTDDALRGPDRVPEELMAGGVAKPLVIKREIYLHAIKTNNITAKQYETFEKHNLFINYVTELASTREEVSNYEYEIISMVLAKMGGKNIPQKFTNEISKVQTESFMANMKTNNIFSLTDLKGISHITVEQVGLYVQLMGKYDENNLEMHKSFKQLMTGKGSELPSTSAIADMVMKIESVLKKQNSETLYQSTINLKIRANTIVGSNFIMIFTENKFLASYVKCLNKAKKVFMVCLETGKIFEVEKAPNTEKAYEYKVNALYTICAHSKLMNLRGKVSRASIDTEIPLYFLDTEFGPRSYYKSATVYDIALINAADIYASSVTYIKCDPSSFHPMFNHDLRYEDLLGSPTIERFYNFFSTLNNGKTPEIHYYHAIHDISFIYENHEMYDQAREDKSEEGEKWAFKWDFDYGYNFVNDRLRGYGGLQEEYEATFNTKVSSMVHIIPHQAVSDALLEMEMVLSYL